MPAEPDTGIQKNKEQFCQAWGSDKTTCIISFEKPAWRSCSEYYYKRWKPVFPMLIEAPVRFYWLYPYGIKKSSWNCIIVKSPGSVFIASRVRSPFWTCGLPMIQIMPGMAIKAQNGVILFSDSFQSPVLMGHFWPPVFGLRIFGPGIRNRRFCGEENQSYYSLLVGR